MRWKSAFNVKFSPSSFWVILHIGSDLTLSWRLMGTCWLLRESNKPPSPASAEQTLLSLVLLIGMQGGSASFPHAWRYVASLRGLKNADDALSFRWEDERILPEMGRTLITESWSICKYINATHSHFPVDACEIHHVSVLYFFPKSQIIDGQHQPASWSNPQQPHEKSVGSKNITDATLDHSEYIRSEWPRLCLLYTCASGAEVSGHRRSSRPRREYVTSGRVE